MKVHHPAVRICISLVVLAISGTVASAEPDLLDPSTHPKFVNELPRPGVIDATQGGTFEVSMSQFEQWLGLVDPVTNAPLMTTVWGYNGSYPGPTVEARTDVPVDIRWTNDLVDPNGPLPHILPVDVTLHWADPDNWPASGVPLVTHVHGGHTESASDGLPEAWFTPGFAQTGQDWVKETYHYDNDQEAATIWYHDHALGITRLNVYAGLAGFYLIRDDWELGLNLPSGEYEVPIAIQDRMFTADGKLYYPSEPEEEGQPEPSVLPEFFGDFILVNGKTWPYLEVEPRKYRLRFLNGSDSRFYSMWITSEDMTMGPVLNQIGTDNGLLYAPVPLDQLTFAPGERADVVVDFAGWEGHTLTLRNRAKTPYPNGETIDPNTAGQLMQFRVSETPVMDPSSLPSVLRQEPIALPGEPVRTRKLLLFEGEDQYGRLQPLLGIVDPDRPELDGTLLWDEEITENPMLDDVETWEVYNATVDAHPIHLHLVSFQILSRQKFTGTITEKEMMEGTTGGILSDVKLKGKPRRPAPNESGWKDTAQMFPGEVTRVIAKFDREGLYVWHCHILSHEDHEMMRPYYVGTMPPPGVAGPERPTVASTLLPNQPNPFNPQTQIGFIVPERGQVQVTVYDATGRLVQKLVDGVYEAGRHSVVWDGRNADGGAVASGIYIYELRTGDIVQTGKMVLAR